MRCAGCSRQIPSDAAFCIYCATPVGEAKPTPAVQSRPATGPTVRLQPADAQRVMRPSPSVVTNSSKPRTHKKQRRHKHDDPSGMIFMLGLVFLWFTNMWWPGIIVLIAISSFFKNQARGRFNHGLSHLVFWVGLVLLWNTAFFWPGLIVLLVVSHHIGKQKQPVTWI